MTKEEIREGDIVEIDYIEEFTEIHRKKGKALVLWKGLNNQPLITLLEGKYSPKWSCYEYISKVIGHISLEEALEQEPCEDAISRLDLRDAISNLNYWHANQYGELRPGGAGDYATVYKANDVERMADNLPSVQPKIPWITLEEGKPDDHQLIWFTDNYGCVDKGEVIYGYTKLEGGVNGRRFDRNEIVAWMPINKPEPYKVESEK